MSCQFPLVHVVNDSTNPSFLPTVAPAMMNTKIMSKAGTRLITHNEDSPNALLELPVPDNEEETSLLRGYNATAPGSLTPRLRRRKLRSTLSHSQANKPLAKPPSLPASELNRQSHEILQDQQNIAVRREILNKEMAGVEEKIRALEDVKERLQKELLGLREEELELEDECTFSIICLIYPVFIFRAVEGVLNNISRPSMSRASTSTTTGVASTRRKKGPSYLPAEHDVLPPHVAFTVSHTV